jgi:hypothetical protein
MPQSGRPYPDDSPYRGLFYKTVVIRSRRWAYRITYEIVEARSEVWVRYVYPSWYPATHPGLAAMPPDDDE